MADINRYLDDLCVRFVMNVTAGDQSTVERICFQIEEAHWYYEDFIRPSDPSLRQISLRHFTEKMFTHCPILSLHQYAAGDAYTHFMEYKERVPVRGAILLNAAMDKVVLVKGWKKGSSWSFPRGKINMNEDDLDCAIRETYEETGFHLEEAGYIPQDRNVKSLESTSPKNHIRLYVFPNIPEDTFFETRTRKEISKIEWWKVSDLPAYRRKGPKHADAAMRVGMFFGVAPFLPQLRDWVVERKQQAAQTATSIQILSTDLSNDEFLTEEDVGAESGTQLDYPDHSEGEDMADASAALSRILNIGEPNQETESDFEMDAQSNQKGSALLALLQNKQQIEQPRAHNAPPPHTPLEHNGEAAHMPKTPHHHHPRPPTFSSMPPPPNFPSLQEPRNYPHYQSQSQHIQQQPQHNAFSYQQPNMPYQPHPQPRHQQYSQNIQPNIYARENPHHYQPQHLIHPQPLPPTVQKTLFTGGSIRLPEVPQARPLQPPVTSHYPPNASIQVPNPHGPMVPPMRKESPPKLTKHSLALLDAFKRRDQDVADASAAKDLPPRAFAPEQPQVPVHQPQVLKHQPQELPADITQLTQAQPHPHPQYGLLPGQDTSQAPVPIAFPSRQPISNTQKSTLLDMFKSPIATSASPVKPLSATALPSSATPSAVELSAVEPLSSHAATTSALLNDKRTPGTSAREDSGPELHPEANLPYRATAILSRPPEMMERDAPVHNGSILKTVSKGRPLPKPPVLEQIRSTPEKKFQPQILKRPQPGQFSSHESSTPTQTQMPLMQETISEHRKHPPPEHRQNLLSLFGKPQGNTQSPTYAAHRGLAQGSDDPSMRSRVGSLASSGTASRKQSQAATSPADTSFLLDYLAAAVAKGH